MADHEHEVRNVLALLRGHLELARQLLASGRTEEVAEDLTQAIAAAHRLEELVAPRPVEDDGAAAP
jgi:nitrogen-specific signal transduction histidine kinase